MDVDQPANLPAKPGEKQPTGADLSNQAIIGVAQIASATGRAYSKAKKFAITMDPVKLCVPGENMGSVHLSNGVLIDAGAPGMSFAQMNKHAAKVTQSGDPVDVVRGAVLDERTDLFLPGKIYLLWRRLYDSGRARESSPFGKGGFTHNFDGHVRVDGAREVTVVRLDDGRDFGFPLLPKGGQAFSRKKRLTLRRGGDDYVLYSHDTRLKYVFEPLDAGGAARLQAIRDAWSNAVTLKYDDGRLTALIDSAQRELRLAHDDRGRIRRAEVFAPTAWDGRAPKDYRPMQHVDYGYSPDGELAFAEDALGHREQYAYDGRHRLLAKTLKNGTTFRYDYDDESDRCVRSAADGGLQAIELYYDDRKKLTIVHGTPEPREHTHDDGGLVVKTRTPDGAVEEAISVDEDQLVVSQKNAAGEETLYEHDEHGNPTKVTRPDGSEITWTWTDDLLTCRTDPGERKSTCEYDARGGLVRWVQPSGRWHAYDLDERGRRTAVYDVAGVVSAFVYDLQHNVIREKDARGATTEYAYDPMGRMTAKKDALGRVRTFEYDLLGRPTRETLPDGTVLAYSWDAMGNVVETRDGTNTDAAEYAGTGALVRRRLADGSQWQFRHDVLERLREVRNERGETHRINYDRAGRVSEEELFDGQTTRYRYGKNNLVSRIDYADKSHIEREYDGMGQLVREIRPDGAVAYERNEVGWIRKATATEHFGDIVTEVTYDADGRILSRSVDGKAIRYTYDALGFLTSRTLPNGQVTRYFNDASGYVTAIEHEGEKVALQRDVLGREVRRHFYAGGLDIHYRYDDDDRLAGLAVMAPGMGPKPVLERSWRRGAHGRLVSIEDGSGRQTELSHDKRGRLVGFRRGETWCHYGYDAAGYLDLLETSEDLARDGNGRLSIGAGNVVLAHGATRFEHDARRRRRREVRGADATEYFWDSKNRLREVHLPSGDEVHLAYDAFGHLVRKLIVSPPAAEEPTAPRKMRWVDYVWDGDELCLLTTSAGEERVFVTEPRSFFAVLERKGDQTLYYVTGPLGVPTELVDARGRVVERFAFGPFGETLPTATPSEAPSTPFRLLGQVFHPELGLASTRYRWFDARTVRWLTADPAGLRGGSDLYGFDGSPTERVDALGLYTAASFQQFLNDTHQPRIDANNAALAAQRGGDPNGPNCLGPATASASSPVRPGQPGPATAQNSGNGAAGHAERDPLRDAQGLPPATNQSGVGAIGAGRPHCGGCTAAIVNTPGAVPASSIRGSTTDRDGNPTGNGGYSIPPASGPPGFLP
jgi:RHS repeat-associated protein